MTYPDEPDVSSELADIEARLEKQLDAWKRRPLYWDLYFRKGPGLYLLLGFPILWFGVILYTIQTSRLQANNATRGDVELAASLAALELATATMQSPVPSEHAVSPAAWSPRNRQLAIVNRLGAITVFGNEAREPPIFPLSDFGLCTALAFSDDGRYLAAGSEQGRIVVFDVPLRRPRMNAELPESIEWLRFSNEGEWLTAIDSSPRAMVFSVSTGDVISETPLNPLPRRVWSRDYEELLNLYEGGDESQP